LYGLLKIKEMKKYLIILFVLFSLGNLMAQTNVSNSAEKNEEENQKTSTGEEDLESESDNKRAKTIVTKEIQQANKADVSVQLFNKYQKERQKYYNAYNRNIPQQEQENLDAIVVEMQSSIPQSFEYHYAAYLNSNFDQNKFHHLQKAYAINPNNAEIYDDFMAYYEYTNDLANRKNFSAKLYNSKTVQNDILLYNYNVLMSLEKNAILFTNGEDDTYPLWIWQDVNNLRTDVVVLNISLLLKQDYLNQKAKEHALSFPTANLLQKNPAAFYRKFCLNNKSHSVYFALSINPAYLNEITSYLYVSGLAYKFSLRDFDNYKTTYDNWNKRFNIEYLINKQYYNRIHSNYLIPLLITYDYEKNPVKKKLLLGLIYDIGKKYNKEKEIEQYLSK
jgi:hypothetical protein